MGEKEGLYVIRGYDMMDAKFAVRLGCEIFRGAHLVKAAMRFGSPAVCLPDHKKCK